MTFGYVLWNLTDLPAIGLVFEFGNWSGIRANRNTWGRFNSQIDRANYIARREQMFSNWVRMITINSVEPIRMLEGQINSLTDQTILGNQLKLANHNLRRQKDFDLIGPMGDPEDEETIALIWPIRAPLYRRVSIWWDQRGACWSWSVPSASKESYCLFDLNEIFFLQILLFAPLITWTGRYG